jgi:hypothetical protein
LRCAQAGPDTHVKLKKKKTGVLVRPSTTLSWVNKGVKLSIEPIKVPNQRTIQKKMCTKRVFVTMEWTS